jgi:hypothetical protein
VNEALSKLIKDVKENRDFKGVNVIEQEYISHCILVDDVVCFSQGYMQDISTLKGFLNCYFKATCMELNLEKSSLISHCFLDHINQQIGDIPPFHRKDIETGFKYLGFIPKPNN